MASSHGQEQPATQAHDPYAALRLRDFRLYVGASMIVVIGAQIQEVALGCELYERTRDPMALAWLGLVQVVPMLGLGLPAGQAADWCQRAAKTTHL